MKSQRSVIVVPGHKISDWYDRAAERCEHVMIELGSTLTMEQLGSGLEQFAKLEGHPTLYARYSEGTWQLLEDGPRPFHVHVTERWERGKCDGVAIVETSLGVRNLGSISAAELWFGPMDYCGSAGLPWRVAGRPFLERYAIAATANAAKALGVPFVTGPCCERHCCMDEALEDFREYGADRKGALNLEQVDWIEAAWDRAHRTRDWNGSGVAWVGGVLMGPGVR